jgi:hypothetical protein
LSGSVTDIYDFSSKFTRYQGTDSAALFARWQDLSRDEAGIEKMLRLIWTDLVASATVGTKKRNSISSVTTGAAAKREVADDDNFALVAVYGRRIVYDLRYAIPAVVLLAAWLILLLVSILSWITRNHGVRDLRNLLNNTATGRVALISHHFGSLYAGAPTRKWTENAGYVKVNLHMARGPIRSPGGEERLDAR